MSLIGGTTKGDSNSFDNGETEFTGEERRLFGAPRGDAPNWIHFELYNITNTKEICYVSIIRTSYAFRRGSRVTKAKFSS
jgi:hypothetical protein